MSRTRPNLLISVLPLAVLAAGALTVPVHAQIIHVDADARGTGKGLSWTDAYTSLQDALEAAYDGAGDRIWVAAGVYRPDEASSRDTNDRLATFSIRNGIRLFGGFLGHETHPSHRPEYFHSTAPTVLDGDIDGNATGLPAREDSTASYHVVTFSGSGLLDGFIVRGGHDDRDPTTTTADGVGGGIVIDGQDRGDHMTPVIRNVILRNNASSAAGSALAFVNGGGRIINTIVTGNGGAEEPGRVVSATAARTNYLARGKAGFMITMTNVTIVDNGGQTWFEMEATAPISLVARNSIFYANALDLPGGSPSIWSDDAVLENVIFNQADRFCMDGRGPDCRSVSASDPGLIERYGYPSTEPGSTAWDFGELRYLPEDIDDLDGDGDTTELLPRDAANRPRIQGTSIDAGALEFSNLRQAFPLSRSASNQQAVHFAVTPRRPDDRATVRLHTRDRQRVKISLLDVFGRELATLFEGAMDHDDEKLLRIEQERLSLQSGLYLVQATGEWFSETSRVLFF